jgi:large subunit ribosomal protein L4
MTRDDMTTKKKTQEKKTLECPVRDMSGKKVDTITLDSKVFDGVVNMALVHQAVTMYQANKRSGTVSTKTRAEVSGGGKKPWKQKGTGRARTGSIRNPIWRHGGVIFGPKPRDFSFTMPQKMRKGALKSSLNEKFLADSLIVINQIEFEKPKTKLFSSFLKAQGLVDNESALVVMDKLDDNTKKSSRNIPKLSIRDVSSLNALDVLHSRKLLIEQSSLKTLMKVLQ